MSIGPHLLESPERVLATLNADGSRRWIRPRLSPGPYLRARRVVAYVLMLVFFAIPYLDINGKPAILIDLPRREFTLFGTTFLPTETLLFMLLLLSILIAIFLVTALAGRIWCGWACPQTVYLEFLFRPIERLVEGGWHGSKMLDQKRQWLHPRRLLKYTIYLGLALFLAHTFLAYFVPVERLYGWMHRSPVEHPTSFFVVMLTTALIFFDFAYFREQTCMVACPYGRLQTALLDRRSLIVGYDARRGEPRMKGIKDRPAEAGDCIDCQLCVATCPTGIDIRDGLQMECVQCTQCMDACDAVMVHIGKPKGLIRYGSQDRFAGHVGRLLRPRVVLYPLALVVTTSAFAFQLGQRETAEVTVLRGHGSPYTVDAQGLVVNQLRVKIANRGARDRVYTVALEGAAGARVIVPQNPFPVPAGTTREAILFVSLPVAAFRDGERSVSLRVSDGDRFRQAVPYGLVGPEKDHEREPHETEPH